MPNLIISTCGTSVFTAKASNEQRDLLNRYANKIKESDIAPDHLQALKTRIEFCLAQLEAEKSIDQLAVLSAEISGLRGFYGGNIMGNDHHILLATDTWLGEQSAKAIEAVLRRRGQSTEIKRQTDLRTNDLPAYRSALSELVKWAYDTLPGYKNSGYKIIFNLTGGFKAVQGFMQTLGMLHADECVYVFERSNELIRLPRLPIQMNARPDIEKNLVAFRRMAEMQIDIPTAQAQDIPEAFLMTVDDQTGLSEWGAMAWLETKNALYEEKLQPSPSEKLCWGDSFERSVLGLETKRLREVNAKIDTLARYLETNQMLLGLDFKPVRGNTMPGITHEMDAWHDGDAKRLYGHYDNDGIFTIDRLDKALH